MFAAMEGHTAVVKQLLDWDANLNIKDEAGESAFDINERLNAGSVKKEIEQLLLHHRFRLLNKSVSNMVNLITGLISR